MPRSQPSTHLLESAHLRHYLVHADPSTGHQILADAFGHGETGALELLRLGLSVHANARTVRTVAAFRAEWHRGVVKPKWFDDAVPRLLSLFQTLRVWCRPHQMKMDPRFQEVPRSLKRNLSAAGKAKEERATLKQRATESAKHILEESNGCQLVLWIDNHYFERF